MAIQASHVDPPDPELDEDGAFKLIMSLDKDIRRVSGLDVQWDADDDVDGSGCWYWSACVNVAGTWYDVTMPDHHPEGAMIDWSSGRSSR